MVPEGALELNLSFLRPPDEGSWTGFIDIVLEGGAMIRLPYEYELIELDPEISFTTPEDQTEANSQVPINLHAMDIGAGFNISALSWTWPGNNTTFPANSVWGLATNGSLHDLTHIWNGIVNATESLLLREAWVNATLPATEQWFQFQASVSDASGRYAESHLAISYDVTSPMLAVHGVPWISGSPTLEFQIQTEPGALLVLDGEVIPTNSTGFANITTELAVSSLGLHEDSDDEYFFYHNDGQNEFSITSTDNAGNAANTSFQVVHDPNPPSDVSLISIKDQASYSYGPDDLQYPINITSGEIILEIPADAMEWCVFILYFSWVQTSDCTMEGELPPVLNESTGFPMPGNSQYPSTRAVSVPLELDGLGEGEIGITIALEDWAGNAYQHNWSLVMDSTPPDVSWALSPSNGNALGDHFQNLSWWSSEEVSLWVSVNGEALTAQFGSEGVQSIILNTTGTQSFCIHATDRTAEQENRNSFHECRIFELPESSYDTAISGDNQPLVSLDSVEILLDRHHSQEVRWTSLTTGETGVIGPGEGTSFLSLDLVEGTNDFVIEIDSLDSTDSYSVSIDRDSTPPELEFNEEPYQGSTLTTLREVSGHCEEGLLVRISSQVQSRDIICPEGGQFSINITVPGDAGQHVIEGFSMDHAKNTQSYQIEVLKQDWIDWAIDDAQSSGTMLWVFSAGAFSVFSAIVVFTLRISSRRARGAE
jgi:hypothetical protein